MSVTVILLLLGGSIGLVIGFLLGRASKTRKTVI